MMSRVAVTDDFALLHSVAKDLAPEHRLGLHLALCDYCDRFIQGSRFKCLHCEDYDLCEVRRRLIVLYKPLQRCFEHLFQPVPIHPLEHIFASIKHPLSSVEHVGRKLLSLPGTVVNVHHSDSSCGTCASSAHSDSSCGTCGRSSFRIYVCMSTECKQHGASECGDCFKKHNPHHISMVLWSQIDQLLVPCLPIMCMDSSGVSDLKGAHSPAIIEGMARTKAQGPIEIRAAMKTDIDAIVATEGLCFDEPWGRETMASLVVGQRKRISVTVAAICESAEILGFIIVDCRPSNDAHIMSICVHPQWRRKHIAQSLIREGVRGRVSASLHVHEGNSRARRLYERLGFLPSEVVHSYYGVGAHAIHMIAPLPLLDR